MGKTQKKDTEFLRAVGSSSKPTTAIAEELGMTRRGAALRLNRLNESGVVEKEKDRGKLQWSLTREGAELIEED